MTQTTSENTSTEQAVENEQTTEQTELQQQITERLRTIFDPEIPVNIYDLGLIYNVDVTTENNVHIQMTLTTPACPVAQTFPATVEAEVKTLENVNEVTLELVWDPPWTQSMMTEAAQLQLGLF